MNANYKNVFGYSERLPENIRNIFVLLCDEVQFLQSKRDLRTELYSKKENTDLLFELAPWLFKIIARSLRDDIIITICRLSDPAESNGDKNLSLEYLVNNCPDIPQLSEVLADFKTASKPVKKFRNKQVGHKDLKTALNVRKDPLAGVTQEQIDLILKLASTILQTVYGYYDGGDIRFQIAAPGKANVLIYWLNEGKQFHDRKFPRTA